jgi:CubicO group peptidase (beta-lactamase class C family)
MRPIPLLITALFAAATPAFSADALPEGLRAELDRRVAADSFSGVALLARHGEIVYLAAHGEADRDHHQPITAETRFRFGSLGKMFTAVAVMQLAQAGKLKLDDTVAARIPNYPNAELGKATIHQLLTHTAGAGDIFGPEFMAHRAGLRQLTDYVALFGQRPPDFTPGARHEYSNYGYILLGRIIEVASGESYADYVREQVFTPAGMRSTDNLPEDTRVPGLAIPYSQGRSAEDALPWSGTSAGGGYSTARDLLRFANALRSFRLLDAEHTRLLLAGKVDTPRPGLRYAYGFEDATLPDGKHRVGHGGGAPGMNAVLSIFPESDHVFVVLANQDPPAALEIDRALTRALPPTGSPAPRE